MPAALFTRIPTGPSGVSMSVKAGRRPGVVDGGLYGEPGAPIASRP